VSLFCKDNGRHADLLCELDQIRIRPMARAAITFATCGYKRATLETVLPQELFRLEHGIGARFQKALVSFQLYTAFRSHEVHGVQSALIPFFLVHAWFWKEDVRKTLC